MGNTILVADADVDAAGALCSVLEGAGYQAQVVSDGRQLLEVAFDRLPDLVVLDALLPLVDGLTVCRRLRSDSRTHALGLILLSASTLPSDRVEGLGAGADDYLAKPADTQELLARIETALRRSRDLRAVSPLTGLPGNHLLERELGLRVAHADPVAVAYVDLNDFKSFNDRYGFLRGDGVILLIAEVLVGALADQGGDKPFVGHIGGDDFLVLCRPEDVETFCERVMASFDERIVGFYDPEDSERGYLELTDRRGELMKFPLVSVAVGVATTRRRRYADHRELVSVANEMKNYVKRRRHSAYAIDGRAGEAASSPGRTLPGPIPEPPLRAPDPPGGRQQRDVQPEGGSGASDQTWMERALRLAERGHGLVSPNPLVGCVLVADGEAVGEGWHAGPGTPHAEVVALVAAGAAARGSTAFVTLEPCAHTGRTGPCATALLRAGVARVVVAIADPHPVARGGADVLRRGGVEVTFGVGADQAAEQNRVFLHGVASGRPYVTLKAAISLDGRIAGADGSSQWLTGPAARERAHLLRAESDAVLVGSSTVLADDPRLTVRLAEATPRQPLRVVLDARARTPVSARVLDGQAPTVIYTAARGVFDPLVFASAKVVRVATGDLGGLDLNVVLHDLFAGEVRSVLVEGGAEVAGSFIRAGLVDELVCHIAPVVLGERGRPLLVADGITTLAGAPRFAPTVVERVGDDVLLTLAPIRVAEGG